jgi:hypothetical protein
MAASETFRLDDRVSQHTQPPEVTFVAPAASMGDYGANHGNVWDMAEPEPRDIVYQQEPFKLERRPESEGTIVRGYPGERVLAIALWASSQAVFPADQYHHMVFRLRIQAPPSCWTNGRVGYATRWPNWYPYHFRRSNGYVPHIDPLNCPYGSYCIYYADLARYSNYPGSPTWFGDQSTDGQSAWVRDPIKAFAILPYEWCVDSRNNKTGWPSYFDLDFVYLTGDVVARAEDGYRYTLRYALSAPDSDVITATIRYQERHEMTLTGQQPPCNANNWDKDWRDFNPVARRVTVIKPPQVDPPERVGNHTVYLPVIRTASASGNHESYTLDFSDGRQFTDGKSYYLCIEADDGTNRTYQGSDTPVVRVPRSPWFGPN